MATQGALTRTVEGRASHSEVQLVVRHMMVAKVRGRFREPSGTSTKLKNPSTEHRDSAFRLFDPLL